MRKLFAALLVSALALTFAACGSDAQTDDGADKTPPAQEQDEDSGQTSGSRIEKIVASFGDTYFIRMEMEEDMDMDGALDKVEALSATKNGTTCNDMTYLDQRVITIYDDGTAYTIDPQTKTYTEYYLQPEEMEAVVGFNDDVDYSSVTAGTEEIDGVVYDYEELDVAGLLERYYFDGDTWVGLRSQESYVTILDYGVDVEDSWFEIPKDYVKVENDIL